MCRPSTRRETCSVPRAVWYVSSVSLVSLVSPFLFVSLSLRFHTACAGLLSRAGNVFKIMCICRHLYVCCSYLSGASFTRRKCAKSSFKTPTWPASMTSSNSSNAPLPNAKVIVLISTAQRAQMSHLALDLNSLLISFSSFWHFDVSFTFQLSPFLHMSFRNEAPDPNQLVLCCLTHLKRSPLVLPMVFVSDWNQSSSRT